MMTLATWQRAGAHLVPALALLGAAPAARAKPAWTSGTFVYADLCTLPESGTRAGQRVILRRSPNGDGLTYEGAENSHPVAAASMSLDDATKAISFAVETDSGSLQFRGVAGSDALTGTLTDEAGAHPVHLPRVLRSHAHEACPDETTTGSIGRR
jgi:hypothetical protein